MSTKTYIAGQISQLKTAEHHYTLQLGSDAGGKTNFINLTPEQFALIVPILLLDPAVRQEHDLNRLIAEVRANLEEPISVQYAEDVFIEIRPESDDCRVSVMKRDHGFTCVNYTHEGLILDVLDENVEEVHSLSVTNDGLTLDHADSSQQQQPTLN
jgi:hypothetical protein